MIVPLDKAPIVQAHNLSIGYKHKKIGQRINFTLQAGHILCLLGPNGSGKSTLFKSTLGLLPLLGGEVSIGHLPLQHCSRKYIAQHIAYVPQASAGMFAFRVVDVVLMGRSAHLGVFDSPSTEDRDIAQQCLEQLGIAQLSKRSYTQISGGEQQLVLLARALAQQPQALILDEPTASLDFGNQIRVLDQIQRLKDQGLAVFLCTHQPEHAYKVADEVLLFKQGQIIAAGKTAAVLTAEALAKLYDLPLAVVQHHLQNPIY